MKIVCDNCATKYSIADEKVVGKVFKIRCKKCSHIIVVKGTGEPEAAAQQNAPDTLAQDKEPPREQPPAAAWHLVIDREQVGPMTVEEVRVKFQAGQIDPETYAWREGFDDWLKLGSIDDFRELSAETRRSAAADLFNQAPKDEGPPPGDDLFKGGASGQAHAGDVMKAAPNAETLVAGSTQDMISMGMSSQMGQMNASSQSGRPPADEVTSIPSVSSSSSSGSAGLGLSGGLDIRPMTGTRSENSVLFSLNNLQALATTGPPSSSAGPRPGYANSASEGSGLIDIRAMAAQTLSASSFAVASASKPDELPMVNDAPMFSPVAPSVLMPSSEPVGIPKWVWGVVGVGGLMFVGMIIVLVKTLTAGPPPPVPPTGPIAQTGTQETPGLQPKGPDKQVTPSVQGAPDRTPGKEPGTTKEPASDTGDRDHKPRHNKDRGEKAGKGPKGKDEGKDTGTPVVQPRVETPTEPVKKPKQQRPKDDLDSLLDQASGGSGGKPKTESVKKDLPEQLSQDQIKGGLKSVSGAVQNCKTPGTYTVKLTVGRNGRVSDASVPGKSGDPAADCVAKAVKGARFPEFSGDPQSLTFPFFIR